VKGSKKAERRETRKCEQKRKKKKNRRIAKTEQEDKNKPVYLSRTRLVREAQSAKQRKVEKKKRIEPSSSPVRKNQARPKGKKGNRRREKEAAKDTGNKLLSKGSRAT
jgi:hypothetical protein